MNFIDFIIFYFLFIIVLITVAMFIIVIITFKILRSHNEQRRKKS